MEAGGYGDQQISGAVSVLATADLPLRKRLELAWTQHLVVMDPKVDLAPELRDDFDWIGASMQRLGHLTESQLPELASRILELHDRVQEIVTGPRKS